MRCGKTNILSLGIHLLTLLTVVVSMSVCQAQEETPRPGVLTNLQNRLNASPLASWMPGRSDEPEEEVAPEAPTWSPEMPQAQPITPLSSRQTNGMQPPVSSGRPSVAAQSSGPYVPYRSGAPASGYRTPASGYQPPASSSYGSYGANPSPYGSTSPRPPTRPPVAYAGAPRTNPPNPSSSGVSGRMSAFQGRMPESTPSYRTPVPPSTSAVVARDPYSRSGSATMDGTSGYAGQRSGSATMGSSTPSRNYGEASLGTPPETPQYVADARSVGEALSAPVVPTLPSTRGSATASREPRRSSVGSQYMSPTVSTRLGAGEADASEAGIVANAIQRGRASAPETPSAPQEIASAIPSPSPVQQVPAAEVAAVPQTPIPSPLPVQQVPVEVAAVPQTPTVPVPSQEPVARPMPAVIQPVEEPVEQVLVQHDVPVLSVETLGPSRILVGTESTYEVRVSNASSSSADQVIVSIGLPAWAEVVSTSATTGSATASTVTGEVREYQWRLDRLDARSQEELAIRIVPRESRPIDLQVQLDYEKAAARTMIEVQEPRVEMALEGPSEVLWGRNYAYRLKINNTGTGDATNVRLVLSPLGGDSSRNAEAMLPLLRAGEEKVMELSLTAVKDHQVSVEVTADADNGVHADLSRQISVLRADLEINVDSPELLFVGNEAEYSIRVRNTGTATAEELAVTASLPINVRYVSCVGGGRFDEASRQVAWSLEPLPQGTERTLTLLCEMTGEGDAQVQAIATAATEVSDNALAAVQVEAMADLALTIEDPSGPVAVGDVAEYRLTIRNRGTKRAEDVRVVVSLDVGVEPTEINGARYGLGSGQIIFDSFPSIEVGGETVLTINAESSTPGNHPFRVEVAAAMGVRLSSEESTYFYGSSAQEATPASLASPANSASPTPLRMQEMPVSSPMTPVAPAPMPFETPTPAAGMSGMAIPVERSTGVGTPAPLGLSEFPAPIDLLPPASAPQALSNVSAPETLTPVE